MSDAPMTNEPLPLCLDDPGVSMTWEIAGETPTASLPSILHVEIWRDHGPEETFGPKEGHRRPGVKAWSGDSDVQQTDRHRSASGQATGSAAHDRTAEARAEPPDPKRHEPAVPAEVEDPDPKTVGER